MDKILSLLVLPLSAAALWACWRAWQRGDVLIKGVRCRIETPVPFAGGLALIAGFALLLPLLLFALPAMRAPLALGPVELLGGMALIVRVLALFVAVFVVLLLLTRRRLAREAQPAHTPPRDR
jgi:hypothetical protein